MYTLKEKLTNILTRKSMPDGAGLILGQIPHCTEKCPGYARGVGGFGIDWYKI